MSLGNYLMIFINYGRMEGHCAQGQNREEEGLQRGCTFLRRISPNYQYLHCTQPYFLFKHLLYYLYFQGEDGFPGFKGDMGLKGDRVSEKKISTAVVHTIMCVSV